MHAKQKFIIINITCLTALACAYPLHLLDVFFGEGLTESSLMVAMLVVFLWGQWAVFKGNYDLAEFIAHMMPKFGLVFFSLAVAYFCKSGDLLTPLGKTAFTRAAVLSIPVNSMAIIGLMWLEFLVRGIEVREKE